MLTKSNDPNYKLSSNNNLGQNGIVSFSPRSFKPNTRGTIGLMSNEQGMFSNNEIKSDALSNGTKQLNHEITPNDEHIKHISVNETNIFRSKNISEIANKNLNP